MESTLDQFAEQQKGYLDALNDLAGTLIHATDQVARLNLAATQALFQDASIASKDLLGSKSPQESLAVAGAFVQPAAERLVGYSRNAYSITSAVGAELYKLVEIQLAEGKRRLAEIVELSLKNAPPGSEATVAFMKSALAASNGAYDTVASAAKKATEMAQSNLAAFGSAATDAVQSKPAGVA
jgi:phasin family protein